MMKLFRFAATVTIASTVLAPGVLLAQTPANVTVRVSSAAADYVHKANGGGGAWRATVTTIPVSLRVPASLIVYCFDNKRQFQYNTDMPYKLLSFSDFLSSAGVTGGGGVRANQWNSISVLDLNFMVERVSGYAGDFTANSTIQNSVWDAANNGGANASPVNSSPDSYSDTWMILVDRSAWEAGLRDDELFAGRQSFLVQIGGGGSVVPEPASFGLVGAGLLGLGFASRRRKGTA